jgi:hypothetical protein
MLRFSASIYSTKHVTFMKGNWQAEEGDSMSMK